MFDREGGSLAISIDGPTASGKTSLGTALADRHSGAFLDTGLTFRALAYVDLTEASHSLRQWRSLVKHVPQLYERSGRNKPANMIQRETISVRGEDVTDRLWSFDVDNRIDRIASSECWREQILAYHAEIVEQHPVIIAAGRDVGTSLLQNATLKVFLTASFAVRRERRRAQHRQNRERSVVVGAMTRRDYETLAAMGSDSRSAVIDTTLLPRSAVLASIERILREMGHDEKSSLG